MPFHLGPGRLGPFFDGLVEAPDPEGATLRLRPGLPGGSAPNRPGLAFRCPRRLLTVPAWPGGGGQRLVTQGLFILLFKASGVVGPLGRSFAAASINPPPRMLLRLTPANLPLRPMGLGGRGQQPGPGGLAESAAGRLPFPRARGSQPGCFGREIPTKAAPSANPPGRVSNGTLTAIIRLRRPPSGVGSPGLPTPFFQTLRARGSSFASTVPCPGWVLIPGRRVSLPPHDLSGRVWGPESFSTLPTY